MNATREGEVCRNCTESWINTHLHPRKIVDHVEFCVIAAAAFMIVLVVLSPRRRQSRSIIIRYVVEGVFILSLPLISYTMGLMKGQIITSELYAVWAMFLAMLFGGTNGMAFQKLDGSKHGMQLYLKYLLIVFYVGTIINNFLNINKRLPHIWPISMALNILFALKIGDQWGAADLASKPSSDNGIKWLTLYMKREHQLSTSYDPQTMKGYKYGVLIHSRTPITLDTIWCDNIGIFSSSNYSPPIRRLKDLCLSFAFFHLVVRRYFGYTCPESKLDKTRVLVLDGLLQTEQDYERAFQVTEAELAFLYDFFFTKYAYIMYGNEASFFALSLILTLVSITVGTWSLSGLNTDSSILDDLLVRNSTSDVVVTKIVLGVLSICQLLQIWSYLVSDWAKVSLVCKYVTHPSWQGNGLMERLILLQGIPHKWLRYWRNNIGQYSVLDSFTSSCSGWVRVHIFKRKNVGRAIELPMEVKKAVARIIKNSGDGHLSNGTSALKRHGRSDELCWACQISDEFTLTHSILVWHVATSYCEISKTVKSQDENDVQPNQVVATCLSKYCAYLVASAPTLLPGSAAETKCTLDALEEEAKEMLQDLVSPREKYEKLRELQNVVGVIPSNVGDATAGEATSTQLLSKGAMLGKALESMENHALRWDLLADFWAEMIVYVAPSDNVAGHIELLAQGGEFVTHVWALLMHAGILERPATTTIP